MSDAEIERIFRPLDRIEDRIGKLEEREAMRRGAEMTRWQMLGAIATLEDPTVEVAWSEAAK